MEKVEPSPLAGPAASAGEDNLGSGVKATLEEIGDEMRFLMKAT